MAVASNWPPVVDINKSDLKSLDNLNLARKRPWNGCRVSHGEVFTDNQVIFNMRYLAKRSLAKELKEREKSGYDATEDELRQVLQSDPEYVAKTRGYVSRHRNAKHAAEHLAVVSWKNYQKHWSVDAKLLKLVRYIVGDHKAYTDGNAIMVLYKPSGNPAAALKLYELPIEL
jgi:hypothetical protein